MKIAYLVAIAFLVLISAGCVPQRQQMYYWGNYSKSLYNTKKLGTEENLLQHTQNLEAIVKESQTRNLRVPPGVYAELGYIYFRQNKNSEAIKYFQLEENLYPESKILMQRLTQAAKAREDSNEDKKESLASSTAVQN